MAESCSSLRKLYNFKVACIFGGGNRASQAQELTGRPDIVVATPGRLLDLAEHASGALSELLLTSTECAACCVESLRCDHKSFDMARHITGMECGR